MGTKLKYLLADLIDNPKGFLVELEQKHGKEIIELAKFVKFIKVRNNGIYELTPIGKIEFFKAFPLSDNRTFFEKIKDFFNKITFLIKELYEQI